MNERIREQYVFNIGWEVIGLFESPEDAVKKLEARGVKLTPQGLGCFVAEFVRNGVERIEYAHVARYNGRPKSVEEFRVDQPVLHGYSRL
jgi:hypothetical protein